MSERAKLPRYADNQGIPYDGAYKMWRGSMLDGIQLPTGTILVFGWKSENNNTHEAPSENTSQRALNIARVSSTQNRDSLDTQAQRPTRLRDRTRVPDYSRREGNRFWVKRYAA